MTSDYRNLLFIHLTDVLRASKRPSRNIDMERHMRAALHAFTGISRDLLIFQLCQKENQAMARFNQSTFASLTVTSDDKKTFEAWVTKNSITSLESLHKLVADGFKVSVSWIDEQNAFCFSIIGTEATKKHKGMVMTTWSDDLDEVIVLASFKHYVICDGQEWPTVETGQRWG